MEKFIKSLNIFIDYDKFFKNRGEFFNKYIENVSRELSEKYNAIPFEQIKQIVKDVFLYYYMNNSFENEGKAKMEAAEEIYTYYYTLFRYKELYEVIKELEKRYEREFTIEEIKKIKEKINLNTKEILKYYPELFDVYYDEMYYKLEKDLNEIKRYAEIIIAYTFIKNQLDQEDFEALKETGILNRYNKILKFAEAMLKGELDKNSLKSKNLKAIENEQGCNLGF